MSNEVQTTQASGLSLPSSVMERLAAKAKEAAAKERPAIGKISLKSGVMSYSGSAMPGNKMEAVLIAASYRNVYYAGRYDPNNIVNPNCFALSLTDEDMIPHENVSEPANPTCAGCKFNEWGSDPNGGRGKACKQTRRLVMLPPSALSSPDAIKSAELAVMDLPVTSVKNYSGYVNTLAASAGIPPFAAITEISVVPDAKTQFKVKFTPMRVIDTVELLDAVESRISGGELIAVEPYESSSSADDDKEEPAVTKTTKKAKF